MECSDPLKGFVAPGGGWTSVRAKSNAGVPLNLSCGKCLGCRLKKRDQWTIRQMHEASFHADNMFLTTTYAPAFLPPYGSLRMADVSAFLKRLRFQIAPIRIRFFVKGEYGPTDWRAHYHFSVFG